MVSKVEKHAADFERRSIEKYGEIFDHSKVEYKKSVLPIILGCKICGNWFSQKPNQHFGKTCKGCPTCSFKIRIENSRKSVEDFIVDARKAHGSKFDYFLVEYVNSHTKVKIICPIHGEFEQVPTAHISGKGCRFCQALKTGDRCRQSKEDFVSKSKNAHGDRYIYDLVEYKGNHKKVKIICREHGVFEQKPSHHSDGIGCPQCGKAETALKLNKGLEQFIVDARKIHGDSYEYSKADYKNSSTKLIVTCPLHGDWHTSPANHLIGSGCPACGMKRTGFDNDKLGTLYVLEYADITKVGITNRPIEKRLREIRSDSQRSFVVVKLYSEIEGGLCYSLESIILKLLKDIYPQVKESFCGSTECFVGVNNAWLLNRIEKELRDINGKRKEESMGAGVGEATPCLA